MENLSNGILISPNKFHNEQSEDDIRFAKKIVFIYSLLFIENHVQVDGDRQSIRIQPANINQQLSVKPV